MDLKQKSRIKWAVEGDENTAFFHGIINANTSCNRINGLRIDGVWTTSPPLVKDFTHHFFSEKFKEPADSRPALICPNLANLSGLEVDDLVRPFSLIEVKNAVWECDGDKAPGPDGINFRFLRSVWGGVEADFMELFNNFFSNPGFTQGCMSSFIALIPKVSDPAGLSDYRPISLVGCMNKVISKVLENHLKGVIHGLISEEQTAFLASRSILDGPLMLNEIVTWLKRSKKAGMLFKVDLEKAYDTLSWGFLDSILEQMNFHPRWRSWIMAIVSSARASVLVNGSPTQEFQCGRGLRQGDPISPFLFIIAMEALSGVVKKACSIGIFKGIECGQNGPTLSHFLYADDVVFLGEWSVENARNLNRIMRCFYLASGLQVNLAKSSVFGVGIDDTQVQDMATILRCRVGSFPFKYLGLQVGANMNLVKHWKPIIDTF
ncbi:putative RNA-directed DNA polymerase [Helianthus annuus]|nr:putative RNA-directed DNA polymerase [Helianthus annuus]